MPELPVECSLGGAYGIARLSLKENSPPVIKMIVFSAAIIGDTPANVS